MSAIPTTVAGVVAVVLLLVDGFIFGAAAKKALVSVILIIVGLILAGFIGVAIPFLTVNGLWTHVVNILISQASHIGAIFYAFPLFWIIGFGLGIWKG
ncbi:MAG TPA: hypothetical protein VFF30_11970 [Nitrososphaerales archaeon]|nr:hypothetical protein [Nitrososphaerales archaeon]